jgi:hypothetical protein
MEKTIGLPVAALSDDKLIHLCIARAQSSAMDSHFVPDHQLERAEDELPNVAQSLG